MKRNAKMLLGACAISLLTLAVWAAPLYGAAVVAPDPQSKAKIEQVRSVRQEISLLNLLNGLYLSKQQVAKLIPLAERAAELHKTFAKGVAENSDPYVQHLTTLRDALYTSTGSTPEQKQMAASWNHRIEKGPEEQMANELGRLEDEARKVLTDAQVAVIEKFKPCLIPPKNLRDPVAVGQASTSEKEEVLLDMIRRMPDYLYNERRAAIAETVIRHGEREKGTVADDVRNSMIKAYLQKMDGIRRMPDVDYALDRSNLAKNFQLFDDTVTYHKGRARELGPISRHLLNPMAADVLKKWLNARANDLPETHLETAVQPTPPVETAKREVGGLMHYGRAVHGLVQERFRMGKMSPAEKNALIRTLNDARQLSTPEEKFAAVDKVAARANALAITQTSVDAMSAKLACLADLKGIRGALRQGEGPMKVMADAFGLGTKVAAARENARQGRIEEAYTALAKVAQCLSDFKS